VLRLDGALDGVERVDGKIQSGVKPPQSKKKPACLWAAVGERKGGAGNEALAKSKAVSSHRSPRKKDPESHAKARRVGDRVPQLPKTFVAMRGVLECSGLSELWMGMERDDGKIQSGVKPRQSKKKPA
jgi:hypothetical protein